MKKRALAFFILGVAVVVSLGIVYIDSTKHYLSYLGGSVQLVVNTNQVLTVDTNSLFMSHKYPVEVRARTGSSTPPFSVVATNGPTNLFLVNTNGGHSSLSVINSSFTTMPNSSDGGVVNASYTDSANCAPNGSGGGLVSSVFTSSTNCTPNGSGGGSVNARFISSTNCSPNGSSGGRINADFSASINCSPIGAGGGVLTVSYISSTNCSPTAITGGSVHGRFVSAMNCSPSATIGGLVHGLFNTTTNSVFSAISSTLAAYVVNTTSNTWTALRGGRIFGTATNSTNIVLHSSDGSLISGRFFDNTNLRATNGATILGQPPAGTTNATDGGVLLYGDVSIMAKGLSIGTNGANAAFITNILAGAASLDYPSTAAGTSSDLPITVTGVTSNNCAVSLSIAWQGAQTGGSFSTYNSNDTVFVRFVNNQLVSAIDPTPFTATVVCFRIR